MPGSILPLRIERVHHVGHRNDVLRVFETGGLDNGADGGADGVEKVQWLPADLGRLPNGLRRELRPGDINEHVGLNDFILTMCESMVGSATS